MTLLQIMLRRGALALALGTVMVVSASGCAGPTTVAIDQGESPYAVELAMDPKTLNPPQLATLNFTVTDRQSGKPVAAFTPVYGALLHNVLISRDLLHFQHSYTGRITNGSLSVLTNFPVTGEYYNHTIFQPQGGEVQDVRTEIASGAAEMQPRLVADSDIPRVSQGVQNNLIIGSNPIKAGQPVQLALYVTEKGDPVTELDPLPGGPGLMFVIGEDGENFAVESGAAPSTVQAASAPGTPGTPQASRTATALPTRPATGSTPGAEQQQSQQGAGQPQPAPTLVPGVVNGLATMTAQPVPTFAPVQQTAMVSVMETPAVVPSVAYGPYVAFTHTFPKAGLYKLWFKTSYRQREMVVAFVVRVEQ